VSSEWAVRLICFSAGIIFGVFWLFVRTFGFKELPALFRQGFQEHSAEWARHSGKSGCSDNSVVADLRFPNGNVYTGQVLHGVIQGLVKESAANGRGGRILKKIKLTGVSLEIPDLER